MSNWPRSPSMPTPELEDRSSARRHGRPSPSRSGPATRRTRSASKRSLPGRDRGVDREHAVAPDLLPGVVEGRPVRHELAGALGEQERGVALVEVPDRRLEPEGADRPDAADAEDELLVEAHLAAADVQDVGDRAVRLGVLRQVRVEQQDRDAADLGQPDGDREVPAGQRDRHRQRQRRSGPDPAERQARQVVVGVGVLLVAVGVDRLAEVALAIEQPDADEREGHVAGRLHVVAGEHAEAARVDAERLVEAVLGAEVGDRARQRGAVLALEPVVRAVGHVPVELGQDVVVLGQEGRVVEEARPVRSAAEDRDRVAVAGPGRAVDPAEQAAGRAGARSTTGCTRGGAGPRAGAAAGTPPPGASGRGQDPSGGMIPGRPRDPTVAVRLRHRRDDARVRATRTL